MQAAFPEPKIVTSNEAAKNWQRARYVMPCASLEHLDLRYRERYGMSVVENLKTLKAKGMGEFLKSQAEKYTCPNCGDVVCVHDGKCYSCNYKMEKIPLKAPKKLNYK